MVGDHSRFTWNNIALIAIMELGSTLFYNDEAMEIADQIIPFLIFL